MTTSFHHNMRPLIQKLQSIPSLSSCLKIIFILTEHKSQFEQHTVNSNYTTKTRSWKLPITKQRITHMFSVTLSNGPWKDSLFELQFQHFSVIILTTLTAGRWRKLRSSTTYNTSWTKRATAAHIYMQQQSYTHLTACLCWLAFVLSCGSSETHAQDPDLTPCRSTVKWTSERLCEKKMPASLKWWIVKIATSVTESKKIPD